MAAGAALGGALLGAAARFGLRATIRAASTAGPFTVRARYGARTGLKVKIGMSKVQAVRNAREVYDAYNSRRRRRRHPAWLKEHY